MAYAPHTNNEVRAERRIGRVNLPLILGCITSGAGTFYEFAERAGFPEHFAPEMDRVVYVGPNQEARLARVLKTVMHIVVDEDADGNPVVETIKLKARRDYPTDWVFAGVTA